MDDSVLQSSRFRCSRSWVVLALVVVLLLGLGSAGGQDSVKKEGPAVNPHRDAAMCSSCHISGVGGRRNLRFDADVSRLCRSCHDGRRATREAHPVGVAPSETMVKRIPPDFPLEKGMVTCSTCHDVTLQCKAGQPAAWSRRRFLRGADLTGPLEFCFRCHVRENNRPFNVHDQLEAGKPKADACIWCHTGVPDVDSRSQEDISRNLHKKSIGVCGNCHPVAKGHPNGGSHMGATPSEAMMSYMSAYELQPRMNLPLNQLLEYVRAARRIPRSIPLDENGRITCYSCHNPHEKGLLPNWNPRSIGSEPKQSVNHRLRAREGQLCIACHQK